MDPDEDIKRSSSDKAYISLFYIITNTKFSHCCDFKIGVVWK